MSPIGDMKRKKKTLAPAVHAEELHAVWSAQLAAGEFPTLETTFAFLRRNPGYVNDPRATADLETFANVLIRNKVYPDGRCPRGYDVSADPEAFSYRRRVERYIQQRAAGPPEGPPAAGLAALAAAAEDPLDELWCYRMHSVPEWPVERATLRQIKAQEPAFRRAFNFETLRVWRAGDRDNSVLLSHLFN